MDIHFNIAAFLRLDPNNRRQTNSKIRQMVNADSILMAAGVTEHELRELVYNQARRLRLSTLAALVEYVLRRNMRTEQEVRRFLGDLFEISPEHIWSLLSERSRVELCMGVRTAPRGDHFVIAADSLLQAVVMNRMSHEFESPDTKSGPGLDLRLVRTWRNRGEGETDIESEARELYKKNFEDIAGSIALLHVGTVKSCPTIEMTVSGAFLDAQAFSSEDHVENPSDRSCPFAVIYRDEDPRPASCHAGRQLSQSHQGEGPGMYYESLDPNTGERKWVRLPWDKKTDCAMVFYRYLKSPTRVEMILGGYSGRATRCLAEYLAKDTTKLWPPTYSDGELAIGIIFIQFEFDDVQDEKTRAGLGFRKPSKVNFIALDPRVIDSRVRRHRAQNRDNVSTTDKGDEPPLNGEAMPE